MTTASHTGKYEVRNIVRSAICSTGRPKGGRLSTLNPMCFSCILGRLSVLKEIIHLQRDLPYGSEERASVEPNTVQQQRIGYHASDSLYSVLGGRFAARSGE
uniref:Uncharacterized protein n=1 Tax=Pristionchus pacificus TaxID=54126 RepID=A0A2A6CP47_PRIPA|eukprot:PDM79909.1 hypothetical protein PRIPAC_32488 [Pristionchus pacificus]